MKNCMLVILMLVSAAFADLTLNKNIYVNEGERKSSGLTTVNGGITVKDDARVDGGCKSVNGSIEIGNNCNVRSISTVNGTIRIRSNTDVYGSLNSVNGSISCKEDTKIHHDVQTVNGDVHLYGTRVDNDIETVNGDITLEKESVVEDDIIIKDTHGNIGADHITKIIIDNSVVKGDIINRDSRRRVQVILRNGGRVEGELRNVETND